MEKKEQAEKGAEETEAEKGAEETGKAAAEENRADGGEGMPEKTGENCEEDGPGKKDDAHEEKLEEIKETLQRIQAEFENSRKRLEKEKQDFAAVANADLVRELLPLLDSIDAAEKHLGKQEQGALKGMELVKKQLLAVLKAHGLREIECLGRRFDPMLEDCVIQGKDEKKGDDIVLEELQKGYALNGRVLRHAKVKVNKL